MFAVCWREGGGNSYVNEKVFGPFPVICDNVAGFSFVVEPATMFVSCFKTSIVKGFGKDTSNLVVT